MVRAFFSLQDARNRPTTSGDLAVAQWQAQPPAAANEMMLWTMDRPNGLLAMLNYSTDLFDADTAKRFLRQLEHVLAEVVRDPQQKIGSLPIVPADEKAQIESASLMRRPLATKDIVSLVRARAEATPSAVALHADAEVTYAELVRRVDAVAGALGGPGVGSGAPVALRLGGPETRVIGALGVLASGAALALGTESSTGGLA